VLGSDLHLRRAAVPLTDQAARDRRGLARLAVAAGGRALVAPGAELVQPIRLAPGVLRRGSLSRTRARDGVGDFAGNAVFGYWIFEPAAWGWFPAKAPQPRRPVPVADGPFPGLPVRGRNCQGRAQACWLPVAAGLTPHSIRHSHKSLMAELPTPEVLSHERLGNELGGVAGRYSHVTVQMREELIAS
jgi:hypothetical protein